jgi:hypothetical protein
MTPQRIKFPFGVGEKVWIVDGLNEGMNFGGRPIEAVVGKVRFAAAMLEHKGLWFFRYAEDVFQSEEKALESLKKSS